MKIVVGALAFNISEIIGYAKVLERIYWGNAIIYPGLYPIIYFEQNSVQIAVDVGDPDFCWIDRDKFEWIKIEDIYE